MSGVPWSFRGGLSWEDEGTRNGKRGVSTGGVSPGGSRRTMRASVSRQSATGSAVAGDPSPCVVSDGRTTERRFWD